ncbi:MAG: DUF3408 domain-containing protein [Bacteroides thetaiotaomicron]
MIPNPIIYNDATITIGLIVCCLVVLATVMIPKAIRHRKRVKQNESDKTVQEEQEVEITIISEEKMKKKEQTFDYRKTFLTAPKLEDRKPVFVSRETRDSLDKIARRLGDRKMSVSGFLENMAKHHLEEYKDEVNRLYKE